MSLLKSKEVSSLVPNLETQPGSEKHVQPDAVIAKKDLIAGLNVYLAYERYEEAKQMLEQAILDDPTESSYRIKLLTVLGDMGDLEAFKAAAVEAEKIIGPSTTEWLDIKALREKPRGEVLCSLRKSSKRREKGGHRDRRRF